MDYDDNDDYDLCGITQEHRFASDLESPLCPMVGICGHSFCRENLETWFRSRQQEACHRQKKTLPCVYGCPLKKVQRGLMIEKKEVIKAFRPGKLFPNYSLCQAVAVLQPLQDKLRQLKSSSPEKRQKLVQEMVQQAVFDKCSECLQLYSTSKSSGTAAAAAQAQAKHQERAPIVGECGHTFCVNCVYDFHAKAMSQSRGNSLKIFACPTCHEKKAFHSERLFENIGFRDALRYWKVLQRPQPQQPDNDNNANASTTPTTTRQRIKQEDPPILWKIRSFPDKSLAASSNDGDSSSMPAFQPVAVKIEAVEEDDNEDNEDDEDNEDSLDNNNDQDDDIIEILDFDDDDEQQTKQLHHPQTDSEEGKLPSDSAAPPPAAREINGQNSTAMDSLDIQDAVETSSSKKSSSDTSASESSLSSSSNSSQSGYPASIENSSGKVIELLDSSDDEQEETEIESQNAKELQLQSSDSSFSEKLLKSKNADNLHFLCYNEFKVPLEWHVSDETEDRYYVVTDKFVRSLLGQLRYNHMIQSSMPKHFSSLLYDENDKTWVVTTFNNGDRVLDDNYVQQIFRHEFLNKVKSNPSERHVIMLWCRAFPPISADPATAVFSTTPIQYKLLDPIKDWALIFGFASALHCMGCSEEAKNIYEKGSLDPSDEKQIIYLENYLVDYLPDFYLKKGKNLSSSIHQQLNAILDVDTPVIMRPMLAEGSHLMRFLVLYQGRIFEPTFDKALLLDKQDPELMKKNLDFCCGGPGIFLGILEWWKMVRRGTSSAETDQTSQSRFALENSHPVLPPIITERRTRTKRRQSNHHQRHRKGPKRGRPVL